MLRYAVKLELDSNGTVLVGFPDVPEAHTFGESRPEALERAVEALETALMLYMEDHRAIPRPSIRKRGPFVALPALSEAKLALYSAMREARINKAELAKRLKCHPPQIDRLLDLGHRSRLDRLEAALRTLGKELSLQIRDAA